MSTNTVMSKNSYVNFVYRYRHAMIALSWILIAVTGFFGKDAFNNLRDGGFSPPKAESTIAQTRMTNNLNYPGYTVVLLVCSTDGSVYSDASFQTYYNEVKDNLIDKAAVRAVIGYYDYPNEKRMINTDETRVLLYATIAGTLSIPELRNIVSITPLRVYVGGTVAFGDEFSEEILAGVETAEFGTIPVLFVLLVLALGGLTAGLLPWYVALSGIFWTLAALVALNEAFSISGVSANIVTMFGLGLAIDYSLFIVSRFIAERRCYPHVHVTKILERTLSTAGSAVCVSAVTVFLALSGGLLFEEFFLCSICLAVMFAAGLSAVASNTFLLAQLAALDHSIAACPVPDWVGNYTFTSFVCACTHSGVKVDDDLPNTGKEITSGEKVYSAVEDGAVEPALAIGAQVEEGKDDAAGSAPRQVKVHGMRDAADEVDENGFFYLWGDFVLRYPWPVLFFCLAFLIAFTATFFMKIKYGRTDQDILPIQSEVRYTYDAVRTDFPLYGRSNIYIYLETGSRAPAGVVSVSSPAFLDAMAVFQETLKQERPNDVVNFYSMIAIGNDSLSLPDYKRMYADPFSPQYAETVTGLVYPLSVTNLVNATYIQISMPYYQYSDEAKHLVHYIRRTLPTHFLDAQGQSMLSYHGVAGDSAAILDLYTSLAKNLPTWLGIMMGSVYGVLLLMTRSLLIPLKAVIVSVLSLGATFGLILLLFTSTDPSTNKILGYVPTGYLDGSNIVFIFSIAFGLSVDYEVFLLSRVLETYRRTGDTDLAIKRAMQQTGNLITAAAVMLAVTTFGFIGCKIFFMKVIGVGISIAVVLDATVIRMLLVPVSLKLMGEYNWYCPDTIGAVVDYVGLQESDAALEDLQVAEDEAVLALEKAVVAENMPGQGKSDLEMQEMK